MLYNFCNYKAIPAVNMTFYNLILSHISISHCSLQAGFLTNDWKRIRLQCSSIILELSSNFIELKKRFQTCMWYFQTLVYIPVSGWHMPCWLQLQGTQGENGPAFGVFLVKPSAHSSQNCPANPGGHEHTSTHGAKGP